jgi:hypothetical protein
MQMILVFAFIGALLAMFGRWLTLPKPQLPVQTVRMRVAVSDEIVIIGIKAGDDVTFIQFDR